MPENDKREIEVTDSVSKGLLHETNTILCPLAGIKRVEPCPSAQLDPVVEFLELDKSVSEAQPFPRGTLMPDGRLDLCKQSLGVEGCLRVTSSLRNNSFVKSLMLGTNGIGDAGAEAVAALVAKNSSIETVYLGCNGITASGAESLADVLKDNRSVKGVWLKRNPIGPTGVRSIADLIRVNPAIQVIDLVNTGMDCDSLEYLVEAICSIQIEAGEVRRNPLRLYLSGNRLPAKSGTSLAGLLKESRTVQSLHFSVNDLGDEGAVALATGLESNRTLVELGLASNGIASEGVSAICEAMQGHPSLERLDLGFAPSTSVLGARVNFIDEQAATSIARLLATLPQLTYLNVFKAGLTDVSIRLISAAAMNSSSIRELKVDGPMDADLKTRLATNRMNAESSNEIPEAVRMIRSVYR